MLRWLLLSWHSCNDERLISVKRGGYSRTGRLSAILLIKCDSSVKFLQNFGLVINGKETFVERERPKKVVRCYNCMLYGHIQKNCRSESRCERCGGTHTIKNCSEEIRCCNCGGGHLASSSNCPVYQEIYTKVVINQLM